MNLDSSTINILVAYGIPAIFLGAFFFGESVILTASYLSATGVWPLYQVIIFAFLGTVIADVLWFLLGQKILIRMNKWESFWQKNKNFLFAIESVLGKKSFLLLLYFKFLYGTRVFTIIYLSIKKMRLGTFILYNSIGTAIWLAFVVSAGWFAGKEVSHIFPYVDGVKYGIIAIILLIIIYKSLTAWISKKIIK